jgi:PEP-CTERM motif
MIRLGPIIVVPAILLMLTANVRAGTVTYVFQGTSGSNTVDTQATFTTGAGTLSIALSNFTTDANTFDVSQVITGLKFTVSSAGTSSGLSGTGVVADIVTGGKYTLSGPVTITNPPAPGWNLLNNTNQMYMSVLGNGQPDYGVIGPGAPSSPTAGKYNNANGSIISNDPHNPFTYTTGNFTLNVSGITSTSIITSVYFQFGTNQSQGFHKGDPGEPTGAQSAPEPASMTLLAIGAVGMGGYGLRKWRKSKRAIA